MKYAVFFAFGALVIPAGAAWASSSRRGRNVILAALVFSTALGDVASINFFSAEWYRGPDRGFEVTLTDLLAVALALGLLARSYRRIVWLPFNTLWLALFFTLATLSAATSTEPFLSSFTLWKMIRVFFLYWCVVNAIRCGADAKAVWWGMVLAAVLVGGLGLKQKYLDGMYRIQGPFDHSNTIPLYINLFVPSLLLFGLRSRSGRWDGWVTVGAMCAALFAVAGTFSRAGAALAVAATISALLIGWRGPRSRRCRNVTIVMALVIIAGGAVAADSFILRMRNAPLSSARARDEFNRAAAQMAADHTLGVGINTFPAVLSTDPRYRGFIEVMQNEEQSGVAHHIYYLTAAETGLIGLVVFMVIMLRFSVRALPRRPTLSPEDRAMLWGCLIGLGTMHLAGLLEWAFRITPVTYMFAIIAGLSVALSDRSRVVRGQRDESVPLCGPPAPIWNTPRRRLRQPSS